MATAAVCLVSTPQLFPANPMTGAAVQEMFLKAHGCQTAQGYDYSVPVSAEVFSEMREREAA